MIILGLFLLGLALGSFANALVWRVRQQSKSKNNAKPELSIIKGRSMCPNCRHELKPIDLIPVISWLLLKGRCRYCNKPISWQYPLVELLTGLIFVWSYLAWPYKLDNFAGYLYLALWLCVLVGFMALIVYDLRWMLLPDRIVLPLGLVASGMSLITVLRSDKPLIAVLSVFLSLAIAGGIFYVLYQVSEGKWIGGGDIKLGWVIGLILATPARSFLMLFLASFIGTIISLPLLLRHRLKKTSIIPFGPFLMIAAFIVQLYGSSILHWYTKTFIGA